MIEEGKNIIWLGTFSEGLKSFDKSKSKFTNHILLTKNGQTVTSILSLCFDKDGCLWVGTYENGLFKYDIKTGKSISFTTEDGLPNNLIYAVIEDNLGFIWMSTDNGISRFNPISNTFVNFTRKKDYRGWNIISEYLLKAMKESCFSAVIKDLTAFFPTVL